VPIIHEETEVLLDRGDLHNRYPIARPVSRRGRLAEPKRTAGIHLSGILYYLAKEGGLFKNIEEDRNDEELPLRMAMGLAWEEFAASLYPNMDWQPGEHSHEGIVMTCDGISSLPISPDLVTETPCLNEFKLTWKKTRTAEELLQNEWYWMHQGRGYCWGYDFRFVRWHICYANGDYRGKGPKYMRYLIQFSDEEIEKTGNMIRLNKQRAIEKGYSE
jgi:hypothetical protein